MEAPVKRRPGRPKSAPPIRKWAYAQAFEDEPFRTEYLLMQGADGWELTAIYVAGDAMHAPVYVAVFKREIL